MIVHKFKVGDVVWIRMMGRITDMDDGDNTYQVDYGLDLESLDNDDWFSEDFLTGQAENSAPPIIPGDYVRYKNDEDSFGRVIALNKGRAWVDWSVLADDDGTQSVAVSSLVLLSPEEVVKALVARQ